MGYKTMKTKWFTSLGFAQNPVNTSRMLQEIVTRMGEGATPAEVHLDLAKDGTFKISFKGG